MAWIRKPTGSSNAVLVYSTLSDLQTAYPNGVNQPIWISSDKSWYYWNESITPTTPDDVTGLAASNITSTSLTLNWVSSSGATSYDVYNGATLLGNTQYTNYNVTLLTGNTTYTFKIIAKNSLGASPGTGNGASTTVKTSAVDTINPTGTMLISDSFNRANGSSLGTSDSYNGGTNTAWTNFNLGFGINAFGINTNLAAPAGGSTTVYFSGFDTGSGDVDISATISVYGTSANAGIIFRAKTGTSSTSCNFWRLISKNTTLVLEKWVNTGTAVVMATYGSYANGDILRVIAKGSSISTYQNGNLLGTITDTDLSTSTIHGIHCYGSTSTRLDNLMIKTS